MSAAVESFVGVLLLFLLMLPLQLLGLLPVPVQVLLVEALRGGATAFRSTAAAAPQSRHGPTLTVNSSSSSSPDSPKMSAIIFLQQAETDQCKSTEAGSADGLYIRVRVRPPRFALALRLAKEEPQHAVTLCVRKDVEATGMSSKRHLVAVLSFMTNLALA